MEESGNETFGFNKRKAEGRDKSDKPERNLQLKVRKLNPTNTISYLQILGTGMDTQDTSPSILFFFDKQRFFLMLVRYYLMQGLQRFCTEHKIKLSKIDHVFLSRVCSETAGGIPGLLLTLAGMGEEGMSVNVWGPSNLQYLVDAMKSFIPHAAMVHTTSFGSDATAQFGASNFTDPINLVDNEVVKISAILLRPSYSEGSAGKPGDISVIYLCELPDIVGKFDPEKAKALGLKPGPKYRELQSGKSVKSDHQNIVVGSSSDVMGPSIPGPIVFLVDCPTESHMQELLSIQSLHSYYADYLGSSPENVKTVTCIIHLSPPSVISSPNYQNWMKNFGSAQHIMAGHEMKNVEIPILKSSARIAARLNYLCPQFFPAPGFWSLKQVNSSKVDSSFSGKDCVSKFPESISAENLLKFTLRPHAHLGLDKSSIPSLMAPSEVIQELVTEIPEIVGAAQDVRQLWLGSAETKGDMTLVQDKYAVPSCLEDIRRDDLEIVLLGTGSSQPSKYRNVSSVYINLFSKGGLLLDCGEGTLGQLKRRYGVEGADLVVRNLKCIWISHIHADHHTGLARILALRCDLLKGVAHEPLAVIGPRQLKRFLDAYQRLEDLDMQFLDCRSTSLASWEASEGNSEYKHHSASGSPNNLEDVNKPAVNTESTLFARGSRMQSYWKRPGNPVDNAMNFAVLRAFGIVLKAAERINSVGKMIPGWKILYSGDTRPCPELATFEDDLVEEAVARNHSTTKEAIEVGDSADLPVLPKVLPYLKLLFKNEMIVDELDDVADTASCLQAMSGTNPAFMVQWARSIATPVGRCKLILETIADFLLLVYAAKLGRLLYKIKRGFGDMDSSRRAVESYWRSKMVDTVTSQEDKVTPVYKLEEICELLRSSHVSIVKEVSEFILKRLEHKSPIVKQKALRLIKYAVGKSGVEFRREMQRHSAAVRQLFHYRGQTDPLKGDALNKAVRDTAHEAISAIFSEENKPTTTEDLNERIQGFGNTNFEMPSEDRKSFLSEVVGIGSASIKQGLSNFTQGHSLRKNDNGSYKGPNLRRSLTIENDHADRYEPVQLRNETQGSFGVLKNATSGPWGQDSRVSNAETKNGGSSSSYTESKTREERLLETIVTSGGIRLQPTRDAIQVFLLEAAKLDARALSHALESKLQSPVWQVCMKAVCVLESILRKRDDEHFSIVTSYFCENKDTVVRCTESPQSSLREKSTKVLSLLGGERAGPFMGNSEKSVKDETASVQMPDLIDTGDSNDFFETNDSIKEPIDEKTANLTMPTTNLIDDLFGDSYDGGNSREQKNDDDPFADVSFHTNESREHADDLFSGMTVDSKPGTNENHMPTNKNGTEPFDIFGSNAELTQEQGNCKMDVNDLMAGMSINENVPKMNQPGTTSVVLPESIFADPSNHSGHQLSNDALTSILGSQATTMNANSIFPSGTMTYNIPPGIMLNPAFRTQPVNYGGMGNFLAHQQFLATMSNFQHLSNLNAQNPGVSNVLGANGGGYSSAFPDIFQSNYPNQAPSSLMNNSKKEETRAFDFISGTSCDVVHLSVELSMACSRTVMGEQRDERKRTRWVAVGELGFDDKLLITNSSLPSRGLIGGILKLQDPSHPENVQ
ncbi:hypothetical protein GH714_020667 [Hevea brasiliensis]|uniref:ribonuclease Z n=1 Tax=Hevea brasiliensis TaxID=3981 RepID=A0A6A6LLM7_HEVBR|nr:hypothetical protein GH714_020667 [Hevea brasiliensis]